MQTIFSLYSSLYIVTLVYMLQNTEYHAWPYLQWYWRTQDFSRVMRRRRLARTGAARLLGLALAAGMILQIAAGLLLLYLWWRYDLSGGWAFGSALIISYPVVWAHLVLIPLVLGRAFIVRPREMRQVVASEKIFKSHQGAKIAIVGSYGKTSMKELLLTVLAEGKTAAATPANKNVAVSHAAFARSLTGNEDILLIEYGEGAPGDVAKFARTTHPTHAVITGVAAAHLDHYKSTDAAGKDIFSVARFIDDKQQVYVNDESVRAKQYVKGDFTLYNREGALGWKVSDVHITITGLSFSLKKGAQTLKLASGLLGRHNIGPLSLAAAIAHQFGMDSTHIEAGIGKTMSFEHRMQPYPLNGGWVIDDTYNGNIEGIHAGTELLKELPAKRKLYITPGLVDQGNESEAIHEQMGRYIADSGADRVILMQNSVTKFIQTGLELAEFKGELHIESNPLDVYTNLGQFIAAGDIVMMQNDWPDNYA